MCSPTSTARRLFGGEPESYPNVKSYASTPGEKVGGQEEPALEGLAGEQGVQLGDPTDGDGGEGAAVEGDAHRALAADHEVDVVGREVQVDLGVGTRCGLLRMDRPRAVEGVGVERHRGHGGRYAIVLSCWTVVPTSYCASV